MLKSSQSPFYIVALTTEMTNESFTLSDKQAGIKTGEIVGQV